MKKLTTIIIASLAVTAQATELSSLLAKYGVSTDSETSVEQQIEEKLTIADLVDITNQLEAQRALLESLTLQTEEAGYVTRCLSY